MGWSGSLTASSAVGSSITFTSDTTSSHAYTVGTFTAPRKAVYQFQLKGSGGFYRTDIAANWSSGASASVGGTGGSTTGYLLLDQGQTVYIGVGGTCSAAFVSKVNASSLAGTGSASNLWFVAGAGGSGGARWGEQWNMKSGPGADGGGANGATATNGYGGNGAGVGGSQTGGYAFGSGGTAGYGNDGCSYWPGDGGDGLYGGMAGVFTGGLAQGGGGGSGYIYTSSITVTNKTYINSTTQGGGASNNTTGSVVVTYYAKAELPIRYNGETVLELYYNGQEVRSLVYNGTIVY